MNSAALAIIIPAYKGRFLHKALASLAAQSCQDFNLYIGDDASPDAIGAIVDEFRQVLPLTYQRFETNLGHHSLVGQWNRCISLSKGEQWIWLLADDDYAGEHCVRNFYSAIDRLKVDTLLRFNKSLVGEDDAVTHEVDFKEEIDLKEYVEELFVLRKSCSLSEYIFPRSFYKQKGIVELPLAWGSDKATWLTYVQEQNRLITITQSRVYFRISEINISSLHTSSIVEKKIMARVHFNKWLASFMTNHFAAHDLPFLLKIKARLLDLELWYLKSNSFISIRQRFLLVKAFFSLTSPHKAFLLSLKYMLKF